MKKNDKTPKRTSVLNWQEWTLFAVITVLFGLSIFDRNVLTTMIAGAAWIVVIVSMTAKYIRSNWR